MARFKYTGHRSFKSALINLQEGFADKQFSDELKRMERRKRQNKTHITRNRGTPLMVKTLLAMKLRIDGDLRHSRPHLHVDYGRNYHTASYAIDTGERLAGGLNQKYDKVARDWIKRNRELLTRAWQAITRGEDHVELVCQLRIAN